MRPLILSSLAFGAGALFMRPVSGMTRVMATAGVMVCFAIGALFLTAAVQRGTVSTTLLVGLGLEALISIGIGTILLHERLALQQWGAIALILAGLVVLKL